MNKDLHFIYRQNEYREIKMERGGILITVPPVKTIEGRAKAIAHICWFLPPDTYLLVNFETDKEEIINTKELPIG